MNTKELDFLRSEVATLKGFLTSLPSKRVIERMGLEHRLEEAEARLVELEWQPLGKPLAITFRGAPVEGTRSIDANFGSTALKAFIKATDTVAASLGADELKERGRLPAVVNRSLRIVDTARGSFGFELELPPIEEPAQGELSLTGDQADPYAHAIEETFAFFAGYNSVQTRMGWSASDVALSGDFCSKQRTSRANWRGRHTKRLGQRESRLKAWSTALLSTAS